MRKQPRNHHLAAALRVLRARSKKSLKELQAEVGVSPQIMSRWENAVAPIPEDRLPLYLNAIGMSEADLEQEINISANEVIIHPFPRNETPSDPRGSLESYEVKDESMSPWCEPGERVWFRRDQHPRRYEGCVVEMRDGTTLVRRYERERDGYYFFHRINPESTEQVLHSEVKGIHRITARGD